MKNLLDDLKYIQRLDKSNMLDLLVGFPEQLKSALEIAKSVRLPKYPNVISSIVFTGLGGSAIAGDLIKCVLLDELEIAFIVNRDYLVPEFVSSDTLVFVSTYSGNTEETKGAYKDARKKKAKIIVITSGGELETLAKKDGFPIIKIPAGIPPRCALGYMFVPPIVFMSELRLIKNKEKEISEAADVLIGLKNAEIAKDIAYVLSGRLCAIYGWSRHLDCVITRWRNQLNENSKVLAMSHFLPEMNHNEIMGFSHPKRLLKDIVVIFLRDKGDFRRIKDRIEITTSIIKKRVHKVIEVNSKGKGLLSRICSLIYIGDFVSFYLAILNNEDPTPVDEIAYLKKELEKRK